jgi:hypothetical protein
MRPLPNDISAQNLRMRQGEKSALIIVSAPTACFQRRNALQIQFLLPWYSIYHPAFRQ